jgi:transcriptional regulator with XRE-family HTH domain
MSNKYSEALAAFLKSSKISQAKFARQVGCSQPTIFHYTTGGRFPAKETARKIELASDGRVPISLWQMIAVERAGIYS